jgi:hypothetical protein
MDRYTYRDIIRHYSADVLSGRADADITDRATRRYLGIALNLASNSGWACVIYPPTDETREDVISTFTRDMVGDWRALLTDAESSRLNIASERVVTILRNI